MAVEKTLISFKVIFAFRCSMSIRFTAVICFCARMEVELSSTYRKDVCHVTGAGITFVACWNLPCTFLSPTVIRVNRYKQWWGVKVGLSLSLFLLFIALYPLLASKVKKTFRFPKT